MGYPMAGHLAKAGFNVTVYNRTPGKAERWCQEYNGTAVTTPEEAAKMADIICVCVGNDNDLRQVIMGDNGVVKGIRENTIVIDHTTTSAEVASEMAQELANKQVAFLDGPVSGGQAGAENGKLTVMLGGKASVYEQVTEVLDAYSQYHRLLGDVGAGQKAKMMNQICIAGVVQGLAEALAFGQNAGMDCEAVVDVISRGGCAILANAKQT